MKKLLTFVLVIFAFTFLFTGCSNNIVDDVQETTSKDVAESTVSKTEGRIIDYSNIDYKDGEILVKVENKSALENLAAKENIEVKKEFNKINWYLIEVPNDYNVEEYIKKLNKNQNIIIAEPNMEYELHQTETVIPDVEDYELQWGFQNMNAEKAWQTTTGNEDVVVAIVDTGVDVDHPEFAPEKFDNENTYNIPNGTYGLENMYDNAGHGTHVAGIAADDGRTGKIAGVAWDSKILPIRVENDSGSIYTSYLTDAMNYLGEYAQDYPDRAVVANMSIGGRGYSYAFKDAIDYAAENDVLLVTSAGNDGKRVLSYPSAYNGVVTVAASTPTDEKADFSTTGHWNSVAAPGVKILSTYVDGSYSYLQGTSMASPYVCGAAALLLSENPELTPLEVKNQLEQTANGDGFSEELGHGVIDMEAMLGEIKDMQYGTIDVETNIVSTQDTGNIGTGVITVHDSNGVHVTHGTTEDDGSHTFWALKPGDYTISLSYYDMFKDEYATITKNATVSADSRKSIEISTEVPSSVDRTTLVNEAIEGETQFMYPLTIEEKATYEIFTDMHPDYQEIEDTVLLLLNENQEIIAENDDFGGSGTFSYVSQILEPGNYYVVVQEFSGNPFNASLVINKLNVNY